MSKTKRDKERDITKKIISMLSEQNVNKKLWKKFKLAEGFTVAQNYNKFKEDELKPKSTDIRIHDEKKKRHVVIENKCFGAALTPRQRILYLNVFADTYLYQKFQTKSYRLYFIIPSQNDPTNFLKKLSKMINYSFPKLPVKGMKTKLEEVKLCSKAEVKNEKLRVIFSGKYRGKYFTRIEIVVRAIKFSELEVFLE